MGAPDMAVSISGMPAASVPIEIFLSKPVQSKNLLGNAAPLGLFGFAFTAFFLSSHDAGFLLSQNAPHSVVVGLAAAYGGLAQLLAGILEFQAGNTLGATIFCSYGAFWLSFVVNEIPGFGVNEAFRDSQGSLHEAMGLYYFCWTIFTLMMLMCSLRTNVCTVSLFSFASLTFTLLTLSAFTQDKNIVIADGISGMLTAIIAMYLALAQLMNKQESLFELPVGNFHRGKDLK